MESKHDFAVKRNLAEFKEEICVMIDEKISEGVEKKLNDVLGMKVSKEVEKYMDMPLAPKQVAHIIGKSEDVVYKMCQNGKLNFTKVKGNIFISLKEVNEMLLFQNRK